MKKTLNLKFHGLQEVDISFVLFGGLIFFSPLFFQQVNAQDITKLADSAIYVLNTQSLTKQERLHTLFYIGSLSLDGEVKIQYANKMLNIINDNDENLSHIERINALILLGSGYKRRGDLTSSLKSYLEAAKIASLNNDDISEAGVYNNIANVYTSNEDYNKSLDYYRKVLDLHSFDQDSMRMCITYMNYGFAAYKANLFDSSINLSKKALAYSNHSKKSNFVKSYVQSNLALSLASIGRYIEAEQKLDTALLIMESNNDAYALSDCLIEMGGVLLEQGQIDNAIEKLKRGYQISLKNGLKEQIQNSSKYLYQAYSQKGNFQKALDFQDKYYAYRDSLVSAEKIRELADLRTEFEVGQKQTELDLVSAQKKTQEIILYAVVGGALLLLALIVVIYKNSLEKNRINKILEDQKTQLEDLNHTKDKLFSIISHDLRSPVHAFAGIGQLIKFAVEDNSHEELLEISGHVEKTSKDLSDLLDGLLSWALQQQGNFKYEPEKINCKSIADDISGVFLYASKSKNIKLSSDIDESLNVWVDKNMTLTIIRNLVNNAIKFTPEGGEVRMSASADGDFIKFCVTDNGIGIPEDKLNSLFKSDGSKASYGTAGEKGLGLGLQLVYEFVSMNNGTVEVESEEGRGTTFIVSLPKYNG